VPTLDGEEKLRIPEGTDPGTIFRLRGNGMPSVIGRGRGDLHVIVQGRTPKKLSKDQRQLLERLRDILPAEKAPVATGRETEGAGGERTVFEKVRDIFG
jgi:molecular chaperone DnaJ